MPMTALLEMAEALAFSHLLIGENGRPEGEA